MDATFAMGHRKGETDKPRFRSERTVSINGQWFFMARESQNPVGPFGSKEQAEKAMKSYIQDIKSDHSSLEAMTRVRLVSDSFREDDF